MGKTLICKNLSASYGDKAVLQNINFQLNQGEFACLCGPNGAGKSTLMTLLAGLQENQIKITQVETLPSIVENQKENSNNLMPLSKIPKKEKAKLLAYMQQSEYSTWDFTVREMILQGRYAFSTGSWYCKKDYEIVDDIIQKLELSEFADRTVHSLSGGEFQKVRIARALAQTPDFILLDEPAANLDFIYEPQLMELLQNIAKTQNIGILITIHDINVAARFADKIGLLAPGKQLLFDTVKNLFTDENLSITFNTKLKTYLHPIYNKVQVLYEEE